MKQTFELPWPISTNALWRAFRGRNIVSARARAWAKEAGQLLMTQRPKAITGPVELCISLSPPTRRAFDLDNRCKILIDLLVEHRVIEADDSRVVRKITLELGESFTGTATVTVEAAP